MEYRYIPSMDPDISIHIQVFSSSWEHDFLRSGICSFPGGLFFFFGSAMTKSRGFMATPPQFQQLSWAPPPTTCTNATSVWKSQTQWLKGTTLPETNSSSSHLKLDHPKRKFIFQPSNFRCELLVSGRVQFSTFYGGENWNCQGLELELSGCFWDPT